MPLWTYWRQASPQAISHDVGSDWSGSLNESASAGPTVVLASSCRAALDNMPDPEILRTQIAEEEARLATLDAERAAVANRLEQLRARLAAVAREDGDDSQSMDACATSHGMW